MAEPPASAADSDRLPLGCHHSGCSIDQQGERGSAGAGVGLGLGLGPLSLTVPSEPLSTPCVEGRRGALKDWTFTWGVILELPKENFQFIGSD